MAKLFFRYGTMKSGKTAMYNVRVVNGKYSFDGEQVAIEDGKYDVTYDIFCPKCYYDQKEKFEKNINK